MKTKVFLTVVSVFLLVIAFSNINAQTDLTKLKYFKIEANVADDTLFIKVQKEMEINPILEKYVLVVNITSTDEERQYIVHGDEKSNVAVRVSWDILSKEVRDGLLAWSKPNKTALEK